MRFTCPTVSRILFSVSGESVPALVSLFALVCVDVPALNGVKSHLSRYIRAKLSVWLAAKGKTLKRPAAAPAILRPASKLQPKPGAHSRPQAVAGKQDSNLQPQPMAQPGSDLIPSRESVSDLGSEPERTASPKPDLLSTTLDLLDDSDLELPEDPEVRMDDVRTSQFCFGHGVQVCRI